MDGVWIEPPQDVSIYDFSIIDPSDAMNTRLFFLNFQLDLLFLLRFKLYFIVSDDVYCDNEEHDYAVSM